MDYLRSNCNIIYSTLIKIVIIFNATGPSKIIRLVKYGNMADFTTVCVKIIQTLIIQGQIQLPKVDYFLYK